MVTNHNLNLKERPCKVDERTSHLLEEYVCQVKYQTKHSYLECIMDFLRSTVNKQLNYKTGKNVTKHLTEKDTKMEYKHLKRCSTSLSIRNIQIKIMIRCHYKPITAKTENSDNTKYW